MNFHISGPKEIKQGKTTDIYFRRTETVLRQKGVHKEVVADFTISKLPENYPWGIFGGLEDVVELMKGVPVDLYALPEGTLFTARDVFGIPVPVMTLVGDYAAFAIYETPALGFICQGSGIATKAARCRVTAGDATLLSFGIRRMHPALAPFIDRLAYIGGCDGVSSIAGAEAIGQPPKGTMPHALIIVMGETEAWKAYDEVLPREIPRIALIDTYGDEKMEAIKAAETIPNLLGVRLDTPGSRRGNMADIVREVRWELDIRGYKDVQIFISGGLDEHEIPALREAGATGFGVGTSISNARTFDFAMDIVEVEGKPAAKKGKLGGWKEVYRCESCLRYRVVPKGEAPGRCPRCGGTLTPIRKQYLKKGEPITPLPDVEEIRSYVLDQLERMKRTWEKVL